jgi:hypothetical protein
MDYFNKLQTYLTCDFFTTLGLAYIIIRFVPGPKALADLAGGAGNLNASITLGEALVSVAAASLLSKPLSAVICKQNIK